MKNSTNKNNSYTCLSEMSKSEVQKRCNELSAKQIIVINEIFKTIDAIIFTLKENSFHEFTVPFNSFPKNISQNDIITLLKILDNTFGAITFNDFGVNGKNEGVKVGIHKSNSYLVLKEIITKKVKLNKYLEYSNKILKIKGKSIIISERAENNADSLLKIIFKKKKKLWNYDEIAQKWGIHDDEYDNNTNKYCNKFYQAARQVNKKIEIKTEISDFLEFTKKTVTINNKYLI